MAHARTIRFDYTFDEQAALLEKDVKRLDEIIRGAVWMMSAHAEACVSVPGTTLRMVFTATFPDAPALRIFFSIDDDDHCTAHWIELSD